MPVISMFYGIIVRMFYFDNKEHKLPHIHVEYSGQKAVLSIPDGSILSRSLPPGKLRLVLAWLEIHSDELMANWQLAVEGNTVFKIDALK
jgi:hypothetical protein